MTFLTKISSKIFKKTKLKEGDVFVRYRLENGWLIQIFRRSIPKLSKGNEFSPILIKSSGFMSDSLLVPCEEDPLIMLEAMAASVGCDKLIRIAFKDSATGWACQISK